MFLSLVVFITMRQKLQLKFTAEEALLILRNLKAKIYDAEAVVLEPNKKSKDIASLLKIIVPTSLGI